MPFLEENRFNINKLIASGALTGLTALVFPSNPISAGIMLGVGVLTWAGPTWARPAIEHLSQPTKDSYPIKNQRSFVANEHFAKAAGKNNSFLRLHDTKKNGGAIAAADESMGYVSVDKDYFSDESPLNAAQQDAILAHEWGHLANNDSAGSKINSVLNVTLITSALAILYSSPSTIVPVSIALTSAFALNCFISRQTEYEADKWSARHTDGGEAMAQALEHIRDHLRKPEAPRTTTAAKIKGWLRDAFASHPPIDDRIAYLRKMNPTCSTGTHLPAPSAD